MTKKLIITGSAGFVGINFLEHLLERPDILCDYKMVYFLDKINRSSRFNFNFHNDLINSFIKNYSNKSFVFLRKDINNTIDIQYGIKWSTETDIINFASDINAATDFDLFNNNSNIACNLCKLIGYKNIKNFIQISTGKVYGEALYSEEGNFRFGKNSPFNPTNSFSASKACQDMFLSSVKDNINVKIIRIADQFGPRQQLDKTLPDFIFKSINNQTIKIDKSIYQWTPVVDTVKIIADILCFPKKYECVIHIGCKKINSNYHWSSCWKSILKEKGFDCNIEQVEGYNKTSVLDETEEMECSNLEQRFTETIDWYLKNIVT